MLAAPGLARAPPDPQPSAAVLTRMRSPADPKPVPGRRHAVARARAPVSSGAGLLGVYGVNTLTKKLQHCLEHEDEVVQFEVTKEMFRVPAWKSALAQLPAVGVFIRSLGGGAGGGHGSSAGGECEIVPRVPL